tara:strand:- start:28028 stop:28276 length:249 start_codon:yes stop_codon:yes gene_type:complete
MTLNTTPSDPVAHTNVANNHSMDVEGGGNKRYADQKLPLSSLTNVRQEWEHGSKSRVMKYICISIVFVLAIGVAIGLLIALV